MSMKQFNKILVYVPTDPGETDPAVERAARMARNSGAEVTVMMVMAQVDDDLGKSLNLDLRQVIREQLESRLEKLVAPLQEEGLAFSARLLEGSRVVTMAREVTTEGYQLLIKTSRPDEDNHWKRFSSLARQLTRKVPCAVWIVQPDASGPVERVLAAVEPDPDPERNRLNQRILELAHAAAECDGAELHLLHVWHAYGEAVLHARLSDAEVRAYTEATRVQAEERLEALCEQAVPAEAGAQCHLRKGDPGRSIPRFAEELGVDLLVMGTVARSGVSGLLMGNTAEKTIRRLECSLLTVKPEGFVSPIR